MRTFAEKNLIIIIFRKILYFPLEKVTVEN